MTTTTSPVKSIGRIVVSVSDYDRAVAFYTEKLGFEKVADQPFGDGERWIELLPAGGGLPMALGRPQNSPIGIPTGIILSTDDAEAAHAELAARGVDVDDLMRIPGAPSLFFLRDADGNTLVVAED